MVGHLAYPNLTLNIVPHFRDETYGDVKTPGYNVQGSIIRGLNVRESNVWGHIVPVPTNTLHRNWRPLQLYTGF
jgi:hypothetical protein